MRRSAVLPALWAALVVLTACGEASEAPPAIEVVQPAPLDLWIEASGELKAAKATKS